MKTNTTNNAADAYQARANDIARLMDVLQMELDKHAAQADGKDWGRVGDLGKVRSDLIDMVAFISGMERERIEAFLAE